MLSNNKYKYSDVWGKIPDSRTKGDKIYLIEEFLNFKCDLKEYEEITSKFDIKKFKLEDYLKYMEKGYELELQFDSRFDDFIEWDKFDSYDDFYTAFNDYFYETYMKSK